MTFRENILNGDVVFTLENGLLPLPPLYSREGVVSALMKVGDDPALFSFTESGAYLEARYPELGISIECDTEQLGWYARIRVPNKIRDRGKRISDGLWEFFADEATKMYDKDGEKFHYFPETYNLQIRH